MAPQFPPDIRSARDAQKFGLEDVCEGRLKFCVKIRKRVLKRGLSMGQKRCQTAAARSGSDYQRSCRETKSIGNYLQAEGAEKMDIGNINNTWAAYPYANKAQRNNAAEKTSFADTIKQTAESGSADRTEAYKDYLKQKYGNVRYESVGKDQKSLDRVGKGMSGNDVIIAPNIVEEMANDPEKAAYYERKIDDFFNAIPRLKTQFAAMGLNYTPGGVVIHEDGSVTYIGGCDNDTPETRAKIKAEQEAKLGRHQRYRALAAEAAEKRRELVELQYRKMLMANTLQNSGFDMVNYHFIGQPQMLAAAIYERAVSTYSGGMFEGI